MASFYDDLMRDPASFFSQLNLPQPSSFPTFKTIARQAHDHSTKIFSEWTTLNKILERHEELLRKRWKKKTQEQRRKLLLEAWPNMPAKHRPDLQALINKPETPQQRHDATRYKDAYFWPEINQEDLVTNRQLLLLFLNSRGRNLPEAFAHADLDAFHVGRTSGAIRPAFLNESTMLLSGQRTPQTYGKLVSWEEHGEAFNWMNSGFQFHPGDGLLVLERQQAILAFLVKCCHLLTRDIPVGSLVDSSIPVQPEPESILPGLANEGPYQSLANVAAEAPYRVPAHLDLQRLQSLISARRSAAEDHVWALREDPSYFSEVVNDVSEHRQETLLDVNSKPHPVLKQDIFWDRVLGNVVISAYGNLIVWDKLHEKATDLASLHRKYASNIRPDQDLPQELEKAFHTFRFFIKQASKGPIDQLKTAVPPSPPMRSSWIRQPQTPNSTIIQTAIKGGVGKDTLLRLFTMLWDEQQVSLCRLPNIVDIMQRLVDENPSRFSSHVAEIFSDLALLAETLHQVDLYQPWASTFEHNAVDGAESTKAEFLRSLSIFADLMKDFKDVQSLAALGAPLNNKFYYPVGKRRTRQVTEDLRQAEQSLDAFWEAVDQHFVRKSTSSMHDRVRHILSQTRHVQRTPAYCEPLGGQKENAPFNQRETDLEEQSRVPDFSDRSAIAYSSKSEGGTQDISGRSAIKQKVKTRGIPHTQADKSADLNEIPLRLQPDQQPTFAVSKRAFKVFSTLFFVPDLTDQAGEISWLDFLHAMLSTGFIPEKLYGSVWQFTPTKLDVERSIHFHEPHPSGKIPYHIARRHGRRLNRAYGWTGSMFVLAE